MMKNSDNSQKPIPLPSVDVERNRFQREASVHISKMRDIQFSLEEMHQIVLDYRACQETVSAISLLHKRYLNHLIQYVRIYEKYVRKLSLEDWEQLRIEQLAATNFHLLQESSLPGSE